MSGFIGAGGGLSDPMTTRGDVIIRDAANATARLGIGGAGEAFLSDGTDVAWGAISATAAGLDTQVQFNDGGSLGAEAAFIYNKATDTLTAVNMAAAFTGALTGQADTVGTITGLAPDTATTQATQASITTCANLTTIGTVTTGGLGSGAVLAGVTMTLGADADGDVYYRTGGVLTRLAKGGGLEGLRMNAGATAPEWAAISAVVSLDDAYNNGITITVDSGAVALSGGTDLLTLVSTATTETAMKITVDTLTSGKGFHVYSNTTGDNGSLACFENDNAGGNQIGLTIKQDGANNGIFIDQNGNSAALNIDSEATDANGATVYADVITAGNVIDARAIGNGITSGKIIQSRLLASAITADKTGCLNCFTGTRTLTAATTRSDDYNLGEFVRTSVANNAGATFNAAGSVVYIQNIGTDTSSTAFNDTVIPLEVANNVLVDTNFTLIGKFGTVQFFVSDGTSPSGNLTGVAGDQCWGADGGQSYACTTSGTTWTAQ